MQILTPEKIRALEKVVGVGIPDKRPIPLRTVIELEQEGFLDQNTVFFPTDIGARATAPHFMKDITPCK